MARKNFTTAAVAATAPPDVRPTHTNPSRGHGRKFQMVVSPQLENTITRLMVKTGRDSMADVIRDGIYTLQWVINEFERKRGGGDAQLGPPPVSVTTASMLS